MVRTLEVLLTLAVAAALAGCADTAQETPVSAGQTTARATEQMQPSASGPPFITGLDASVSSDAVDACETALGAQTDGAIRTVGSEFSEANSAVYMRVGANGAPWRCLVSNDGVVAELMFMGDEGAL